MIYHPFEQAWIELSQNHFNTPAAQRDRLTYEASQDAVTAKFAQALADEYAPDLPATVQAILFQRAWADGLAVGYSVETCYINLAEFAIQVRNA